MAEKFEFDVFLSHSSQDHAVVSELAKRLERDKLRVWFDKAAIKPGAPIIQKIQEGLKKSRKLVLCMSQQAVDSEYVCAEWSSLLRHDPNNKNGRLIPLRLDDAKWPPFIEQLNAVDWRGKNREAEYPRLLKACRVGGAGLEKPTDQHRSSTIHDDGNNGANLAVRQKVNIAMLMLASLVALALIATYPVCWVAKSSRMSPADFEKKLKEFRQSQRDQISIILATPEDARLQKSRDGQKRIENLNHFVETIRGQQDDHQGAYAITESIDGQLVGNEFKTTIDEIENRPGPEGRSLDAWVQHFEDLEVEVAVQYPERGRAIPIKKSVRWWLIYCGTRRFLQRPEIREWLREGKPISLDPLRLRFLRSRVGPVFDELAGVLDQKLVSTYKEWHPLCPWRSIDEKKLTDEIAKTVKEKIDDLPEIKPK